MVYLRCLLLYVAVISSTVLAVSSSWAVGVASRDPASTEANTESKGSRPEERCDTMQLGFVLQGSQCVGTIGDKNYKVDADDTTSILRIHSCVAEGLASADNCVTNYGGELMPENIGIRTPATPSPSPSPSPGSGKSDTPADICTYANSPSLSDMTCTTAMGAAQMACEDPTKTKVSPSDSQAAAKAGLDTQSVLQMLGGGASVLASASAGGEISKQCEAAKEMARIGRNLQIAYSGACTAAIAYCSMACGSASSSAKKYWNYIGDTKNDAKCSNRSVAISKAESLYNTASGYEDKCYGYAMKVTQSASAIAQYQMQMQAQGNCEASAQNQIPAECLNNPNAYKINYCNDIRCKDTTFANNNPSICGTTTLVDCSLSANAANQTCICRANPSAAGCSGTSIAESTPKGSTTTASLNDDLGNTKGLDFNASTAGNGGFGGAASGSNTGGGGLSSPNLGGGGMAGGRAGAQGADANIERGYRTGGYSVSGVPLSGGGGGGSQKISPDAFNLSKFLPKGKGKDAFRSLAGMQAVGADGITCANCATLFEKVSTQYRKQTPSLRP